LKTLQYRFFIREGADLDFLSTSTQFWENDILRIPGQDKMDFRTEYSPMHSPSGESATVSFLNRVLIPSAVFLRSSMVLLFLLTLPVFPGCTGKTRQAMDDFKVELVYPENNQVIHQDWIPIWIRSYHHEVERLTIHWNDEDITARFLPWETWRNGKSESLALIHPDSGLNRIEIRVHSDAGISLLAESEFRFDPFPLQVRIQVLEGERPVPARVFIRGLNGTADPPLAGAIWKLIAPFRIEHLRNFVYTETGIIDLHLPEGRYEVIASRGPSYSLARAELGDNSSQVTLRLTRVLDTSGWVSADFHVHAIPSYDSKIPLWDRVVSFLAHDVDVIVASDHNIVTDYGIDLRPEYRLPEEFSAIPGVESGILPHRGHWNFWPLDRGDNAFVDPWRTLNPPFPVKRRPPEEHTVRELFRHFRGLRQQQRRARFGDFPVVIQLNHPRGIRFMPNRGVRHRHDFLNGIGYDPEIPVSADANGKLLDRERTDDVRPIDVDAIELLNRLAFSLYFEVRRDWFAWLRQGYVTTGVANTDSHWFVITEPGFPRNWVRYPGSLPVQAEELARAVRRRQVVGSTGPLVTLEPWSPDGRPVNGPVNSLAVTVRSPAWIPVEEIRVFVNGENVHRAPIPLQALDPFEERELVHKTEIPLDIREDAFVVVEAGDSYDRLLSSDPATGLLGVLFPHVRVLAFTNPLFIDADGDGTIWDEDLDRDLRGVYPAM
jgi:hypothetical protein